MHEALAALLALAPRCPRPRAVRAAALRGAGAMLRKAVEARSSLAFTWVKKDLVFKSLCDTRKKPQAMCASTLAPGVGAGDRLVLSCRPPLCFPKLPPTMSLAAQRRPYSAAGLPASARRPGASPALRAPRHHCPTLGVEWGREIRQPGPRDLQQAPPLPSTSRWWLPALGHQGLEPLSSCQPHAIGDPSLGLSHAPHRTAAAGEHCQAQAQDADGALPPRWILLSCTYMFLPPPMVAAETKGPGRQLCPRGPRKYHRH